jgi:signal transduction histidine kinase/ActR/RegA family two-component response regulator
VDRILYCITFAHDWRWTLAAALLCVFGVGTFVRLLASARQLPLTRRRATVALAAVVGGLSVFSTHFLAMMGYQPGGEVRYGLWLTLLSFVVGVASIGLAATFISLKPSRLYRGLGAVMGLAGTASMHFLGIAALQLPGVIVWDPALAFGAIGASLAIAGVSGAVIYGPGLTRFLGTCLGGVLSIVTLHFVAMSAITLEPVLTPGAALSVSAASVMNIVAAMVSGVICVAGALLWTRYASHNGALRQIREAVEASPDGLAFFDKEDRLVLWNTRYAEVNPELASNLTVGMTFRQVVQIGLDEGLYAEAVGREAEWIEDRLQARKGDYTTLEQRIAGDRWLRVTDRRTAAGGIVTVCTDITELKDHAAALGDARDEAQAASVAKSQFLANMSHEIRTPLNGVIGVAQALAKTPLTPQQQEMLELIHSSGQTLQVLLSDILDLARVESGRLTLADEPYELARAVRDAAQLYEAGARDKGLQFFVEIEPEVEATWVRGDLVRIKQILTNLVSNAVKFTQDGFVSMTVGHGPVRDGAATLRFTVEDTGMGFDAATRDRLFSRFEQADGGITRKFGGSGLGLSISRQLAEMMGGYLDCESEPGGGSAFILTLPLAEAVAPAAPEDTTTPEGAPSRRLRVLLADDHPVNRKVVEMILAQIDAELTSVENGAEAVEACGSNDYDLVLMDMQMPVMDGLTATQEIRLQELALGLQRTPIIMLTANALSEHVAAAEAAGADRHLAKPFDAAELIDLALNLPRLAQASIAA